MTARYKYKGMTMYDRAVDFDVSIQNCTHYSLQLKEEPTVKHAEPVTTPHVIPPSTDGMSQYLYSVMPLCSPDTTMEICYTYCFMNTPGGAKWYLKIICRSTWIRDWDLASFALADEANWDHASLIAIQIFKDDVMMAQENIGENNLFCRFQNSNCLFRTILTEDVEYIDTINIIDCIRHRVSLKIEMDSLQAQIQHNPPQLTQSRQLWNGKIIVLWLIISAVVTATVVGLAWITGTVDALLRWFGSTTTHVLGVVAAAAASAVVNWLMRMVKTGLYGHS